MTFFQNNPLKEKFPCRISACLQVESQSHRIYMQIERHIESASESILGAIRPLIRLSAVPRLVETANIYWVLASCSFDDLGNYANAASVIGWHLPLVAWIIKLKNGPSAVRAMLLNSN